MNIYDISEKSGYSIATVSRVINGKGNVSDKARTKIMAVIEEIGYVPNAYARGLGTGSVQTIGLLCLDVSDMYLAGAVSILERELRAGGYHSLLACTGPKGEDKMKALQIMLAQKVDAVILIGSHFLLDDNAYILQAAKKVPVIFINGYVEGDNVFCIAVDDYGSVRDATRQMLDAGHQHVLYLYDKKTPSGIKKRDGYRNAMETHGYSPYELLLDLNIDTAERDILEFLSTHPQITGIIAAEDLLAIGALKASTHLGRRVPEDLEVIGYNDSLLARCSLPELTSVDSKMEPLCMLAISTLFGIFAEKSFPRQTMLSASLIKRKTTKF